MIHQHELKAEDIRAYALQVMKKHLKIEANGYICKTDMLYDMLLKASAECSSLEAVCADLDDVADSNTQREYINLALPIKEVSSQKERANLSLAECIPEGMARTGIEIAVMMSRFMGNKRKPAQSLVPGKPRKVQRILCAWQLPM